MTPMVMKAWCISFPQDVAALSYANREFGDAVHVMDELVEQQSDNPRWYEMRAQVRFGISAIFTARRSGLSAACHHVNIGSEAMHSEIATMQAVVSEAPSAGHAGACRQ